jgi:hypothetical protein
VETLVSFNPKFKILNLKFSFNPKFKIVNLKLLKVVKKVLKITTYFTQCLLGWTDSSSKHSRTKQAMKYKREHNTPSTVSTQTSNHTT